MKRLIFLCIFLIVFFLCGFKTSNEEELRCIFISYIELKEYLNTDYDKSKDNIKNIVENIHTNKLNTIILQVRPNSDSIYKSNIYPTSTSLNINEGDEYFDVLEYFIKESNKYNIKVIAWINPYRVRTTNNIESISINNPAYKYLNTDYLYINNGIFYNPSKQEIEDLIVSGVEEIINNYEIYGILFDDYFYPSPDIDYLDYVKYIEENGYIDSKTYHLNIINKLISRVHKVCKEKNVLFGVSPDGNINNNYEKLYADIYKWLDSEEYVDFIMPQIYYGFYNEKMPFYKVVGEWNNNIKNKNIDLIVALSLYKSGNVDKYALSGSEEWINNTDIIKREIIISRNMSNYKGFSIYRYDNLIEKNNDSMKKEIANLHQILN